MRQLNLNADLGEGFGDDAAMLDIVTHASIACGGHAGDEHTMREAVLAALTRNVTIGAHPGFLDPEHFGRRRLDTPRDTLNRQIVDQVGALSRITDGEGAQVTYVKLHGALANMAAEDISLSRTIFTAIANAFPRIAVLAIDASAQVAAAREAGLPVIAEAYADRAYDGPGRLTPRSIEGSVVEDESLVVARCLKLAREGVIDAVDGSIFSSHAHSICVHGDTPGAVALARAVASALRSEGLLVR